VHSVRARGLVAHQEVIFGNLGETLTIRHDMPDRAAAMPALVTAVRAVVDLRGLVVGLERVLGLADG
jgi:4-hydroxy-tetrahydrodipicolinate reductase